MAEQDHLESEGHTVDDNELDNTTFEFEDIIQSGVSFRQDDGEELKKGPLTTLDPDVRMEFESEQATYSFYNDYAKCVGFSIRKRFVRRSRLNKVVNGRTYVCSREGQKFTSRKKIVENPRPNVRSGCKARLKVKINASGEWVVTHFVSDHNHELNPQSSRFFRSQRRISTPEKNVIRTLKSAGIQVSKIMTTLSKQAGGIRNVHFTERDCRNFVEKERRMSLSAGDAQIVYEFFMRKKIDAKSRVAYENFGDVITFDTTYLTNKYAMKFAPFVGVNHHGQSVLLGCALITDESKSSFVWVLKTWLTAMLGRPPRAIITDQDKAIIAAIEEFQKCIYDSLTVEEFDERWKSIIELYGLIDHEWLQAMYKCRAQWVSVFLKDIFFAGMSTSQRSESINSFFDGYVSRKTCLKEFVDQYELALQDRLNDEEKADFDAQLKTPHLKTGSPYECQMASIYTLEIFKRFQYEVLQIPSCSVANTRIEGAKEILLVRELILKPNGKKGIRDYNIVWDSSDDTITCICRLFEFKGYLCRHAMVLLFAKGVYDIPGRYILKRWCKGANNRDLFDQESQEASHNSQGYIARCFTDLCADCIRFAEEGSLSKHKYEVAKHIIKEGLEKVSSLSKLTEDSFNQDVDVDDMRPTDKITPVPIIQDPSVSSSKGRPPTKRIKGGTEKSTTKTRTNKCSFCRKPGHNILKCKEVTKNTDEVDEQPVLATTSAFSQMGDEHFEQPVSATPSIFSQVVTQSK